MERKTTVMACKGILIATLWSAICVAGDLPNGNQILHSSASTNEAERIAAEIAGWLEPYRGRIGMVVNRDGDDIYMYGSFGSLQSIFSTYNITVAIYGKDKEVSFIGRLPTVVPKERRREMIEFIFRGEVEYGISPASMILEEDGRIRCQAWMPFESFTLQPKETKWRLMGSVIDKLWSFSEGVASVALGGDPEDGAGKIRRMRNFEEGEEAEAFRKSADADTKAILKRCFDKDAEVKMENSGDTWLDRYSGVGRGVRVGAINARFEDLARDIGSRYDVLPYSLVVKEGLVWNVCNVPEIVPAVIVGKIADFLMRMNENLKYSLYGIDFDTGRIWCQYALPVAVIPESDTDTPRNLYGVLIKTQPVFSVAQNSEELHSAMVKALLDGGDGQTATSGNVEDETGLAVELPLLTRMLNACDAWEAARYDLSKTNSTEAATRSRIARRKYMKYCGDNLTEEERRKEWPFDVEAFENGLAEKIVRDECGLYRVKGDCNDYDEGTTDDGNLAVNPSIRWVNRKMEAWATNVLDAAYRRLSKYEMVRLLDEKSVTDGTFGWIVGTNEYFIVQRVDEDHAFESRDYIYMRRDGDGKPKIAATFNSLPTSWAMHAVRSNMDADDTGQNNVAALMWNGVIDRGVDNFAKVKEILELTEQLEVVIENLELLEKEEARLRRRNDSPFPTVGR